MHIRHQWNFNAPRKAFRFAFRKIHRMQLLQYLEWSINYRLNGILISYIHMHYDF